MLMLVFIIQIR